MLAALRAHTGGLEPASEVSAAELTELRSAVVASLRAGQASADIGETLGGSAGPADERDLEYLAAAPTTLGASGVMTRVARRTSPISGGLSDDMPVWAIGMQPARSFGPFVDANGRAHWFDVFHIPERVVVERGGVPLLVLPAGATRGIAALSLPAGTVWIRANQLTPGAAGDAWAGISIRNGSLTLPPGSVLQAGTLSVPVGAELVLQLDVAQATSASVQLPPTAAFTFGPFGAERIEVADADLTLFGTHVALHRNAVQVRFDATLQMVLVPMDAIPTTVTINSTASRLYQPSGSAPIREAAWGLLVTISQPANLGDALGAGSLVLHAGAGLSAQWRGLAGEPAVLPSAWITLSANALMVVATGALHRRAGMTLQLWSGANARPSTLEVLFPNPVTVWFISQTSGTEAVGVGAHFIAHLDRPVLASGKRIPVEVDGSLVLVQDATKTSVTVEGSAQLPGGPASCAVALSNALISVRAPERLFVSGVLGAETQVDRGTVTLQMAVYQVLPTLPDPYAANFAPLLTRDAPIGGTELTARVVWDAPADPRLDLSLHAPEDLVPRLLPEPNPGNVDRLLDLFGDAYWMLDVSSGADQMGVSLRVPQRADQLGSISIQSMALHAPGAHLQTLLLPQFQWEPLRNTANDLTNDADGFVGFDTDGGPALLRAHSIKLVPVAPVPVAAELVRAFKQESAQTTARFTLPFGIVAFAELVSDAYRTRPGLELISTDFAKLRSERQLRLTAGTQPPRELIGPFVQFDPLVAGSADQTTDFSFRNQVGPVGSLPTNTLGTLKADFHDTFLEEIPIERIDLSGYGASIFSRWARRGSDDVGITQVSFDAFHGRTSYERIMMVSYLWPPLARMIRTIIVERQGSGIGRRWDSGWLPTTPGVFSLPATATRPAFDFIHPGVVKGMFNIREVRDTDDIFDVGASRVQAVYYDADVEFEQPPGRPPLVVSGQNADGRVPVRRQLGYIQRVKLPPPGAKLEPQLMSPQDFELLLARTGSIGGPMDCVIRVGSSSQQMRVTGLYTSAAAPAPGIPNAFAVGVYGSPVFPSGGSWSVVRVAADRTVQPIDGARGVPLIKAKDPSASHRWADPVDLLHEHDPSSDYALLLAHDAQRVLFPRPKIAAGASNLISDIKPRIADPYRMLHTTGLFPRVDAAIEMPSVELTPGALQQAAGPLSFKPGAMLQTLVDASEWTDQLKYADAVFHVDSTKGWEIKIEKLAQSLSFALGGDIFRITHDAISQFGRASAFGTPQIDLPDALNAVRDVLDLLRRIGPQFMRDGEGPLKLSCSMSGTTFHLSAVADFELSDADGNAIECGMGKVKGNLRVGGELSAELMKTQAHGAVFLEITGSWQQLVFPLIYGGGLLRFSVRGDDTGKATFELDACTVGSVGGTVIPGLVDLEATVKYGYFVRLEAGAFHPGIVMGMEGRAKLLSGLLGFKLTVEGRLLVTPENIPRDPLHADILLHGEILVAGSVTVAWLLEERKSFTTGFDTRVSWETALAAAKAGLLPVP